MKSRKFPSLQEAIDYLKSKGKLTYWGWEGQVDGYYFYTYQTGGYHYDLAIYKDGKVEIRE